MSKHERIINKIKKCLSLSNSANEHEAAIALKQAHSLMRKHAISDLDIEDSEVNIIEINRKQKRAPVWHLLLVRSIADAFQCTALNGYSQDIFIGQGGTPEVCEFTLTVLLRQIECNTNSYIKNICNEITAETNKAISTSMKRSLSAGYREGWVLAVSKNVSEFAGHTPDELSKSHVDSYTRNTKYKVTSANKRKLRSEDDDLANLALQAGAEDGLKAQLSHGVNEKHDQPKLMASA